jgi:hypothetical protein
MPSGPSRPPGAPTATAEEGLKALAVALATEKSMADGRTVSINELNSGPRS